jgi:hypothetical protein
MTWCSASRAAQYGTCAHMVHERYSFEGCVPVSSRMMNNSEGMPHGIAAKAGLAKAPSSVQSKGMNWLSHAFDTMIQLCTGLPSCVLQGQNSVQHAAMYLHTLHNCAGRPHFMEMPASTMRADTHKHSMNISRRIVTGSLISSLCTVGAIRCHSPLLTPRHIVSHSPNRRPCCSACMH